MTFVCSLKNRILLYQGDDQDSVLVCLILHCIFMLTLLTRDAMIAHYALARCPSIRLY